MVGTGRSVGRSARHRPSAVLGCYSVGRSPEVGNGLSRSKPQYVHVSDYMVTSQARHSVNESSTVRSRSVVLGADERRTVGCRVGRGFGPGRSEFGRSRLYGQVGAPRYGTGIRSVGRYNIGYYNGIGTVSVLDSNRSVTVTCRKFNEIGYVRSSRSVVYNPGTFRNPRSTRATYIHASTKSELTIRHECQLMWCWIHLYISISMCSVSGCSNLNATKTVARHHLSRWATHKCTVKISIFLLYSTFVKEKSSFNTKPHRRPAFLRCVCLFFCQGSRICSMTSIFSSRLCSSLVSNPTGTHAHRNVAEKNAAMLRLESLNREMNLLQLTL